MIMMDLDNKDNKKFLDMLTFDDYVYILNKTIGLYNIAKLNGDDCACEHFIEHFNFQKKLAVVSCQDDHDHLKVIIQIIASFEDSLKDPFDSDKIYTAQPIVENDFLITESFGNYFKLYDCGEISYVRGMNFVTRDEYELAKAIFIHKHANANV